MYENYQIVKRCLSGDYALVKSSDSSILLDSNNLVDLNPFDKTMNAFVECIQSKAKYNIFNIDEKRKLWLAPRVIDNADLIDIEHNILKGNNYRYYAKTKNKERYGFWYDNEKESIMFGILKNKRYCRPFENQILTMMADFCQEHNNLSVLGALDDNMNIIHQFICGTQEQINNVKKIVEGGASVDN